MPIELIDDLVDHITVVHLSGKLKSSDYANIAAEFAHLAARHGKLRLLLDMSDFQGWEPAALWSELKFDLQHLSEVDRLAAIGDKAWEHGMIAFSQPFVHAKVRYFDTSEATAAHAWLTSPAEASA